MTVEIKAWAKINLTLEVLGRRTDGYHEVRTVLQTVSLCDVLRFEPSASLELECSEPELAGRDNLVWKAAEALRLTTGRDLGVRIRLQKGIPASMGLGGGSSDAAAALKGINALLNLGLDMSDLQDTAASLGSDVPFFLTGGTSLGSGRGEIITQLPPMTGRDLVLLCPKDAPATGTGKTARMYAMLTEDLFTDGSRTDALASALRAEEPPDQHQYNVFEGVAPRAFPGYTQARQEFVEAGATEVHLSGAGPALYSFVSSKDPGVSSKDEGQRILNSLKNLGLRAYVISTLSGA